MLKKIKIFLTSKWLAVLAVFTIAILITGLGGDYALNDDWMYASPVKALSEEGQYKIKGEFSPNIIIQVISGWLLCNLNGGFSFVILRISTLLWTLAGLYALYQIAKIITGNDVKAMFASLILLSNPLYFNMSFTFMSDVPFVAAMLLAIWQYLLFFEKKKIKYRFTGAIFSIVAFLIRQPGIFLFLSFEYIYMKIKHRCLKCFSFGFGFSFALAVLIYIGVELFLKPSLSGSGNYISVLKEVPFQRPLHWIALLFMRYLMTLFYVAFLSVVFIPPVVSIALKERIFRSIWFWGVLVFNVLLIIILAKNGRYFPYSGNVIYNFGLGVPLLADYNYLKTLNFPHLPFFIIMIFGFIIQVYGFLLVWLIARKLIIKIKTGDNKNILFFLILFLCGYTLSMYSFSFFDRYVLPVAAIGIVIIILLYPDWLGLSRLSVILWLLMFFYSVLGTKDYLNWNNAVLIEKNKLLNAGINRDDIFAGLSQNGWDTGYGGMKGQKYVFAWKKLKGYRIYKKVKYKRFLYGDNTLLLLIKDD